MLLDEIKTLCALSGVSGWEDPVRDYLRAQAAPYADALRTDALGNLIVEKKGRRSDGPRLLLCAHMDEVGLMVTSVTDEGYLKFDTVGGIDRRVLIGKRVLLGPDQIPGVVGLKAYHLVSETEEKSVPKLEELYLDIGAADRAEAEARIPLGEYAVFDTLPEEMGEGFLKAKALDDRVGCAVLLTLLREELPLDCTFAFTVQEEIGTRGAFGAAFSVKPELALVLETTTAADLAGVAPHKQVCAPGRGAVIPFMDGGSVADRGLYELLRQLAIENGLAWQTKHFIAGGNDASAVQRSRAGVRTATIAAAVRYLHAPASLGCVRDFDGILTLTRLFLQTVADGAAAGR